MERIMLGMSGGVDSSAAAALLKEAGYEVIGATLRLFDTEALSENELPQAILDAKSVCERLQIEHKVFDLRHQFENEVIADFLSEYLNAKTPNPCIVCNRRIKFGAMADKAKECGCGKTATGHYARIEKQNGRYLLKKAVDLKKDQSYVLYMLSSEQLSRLVLPLGELTKAQIREIAEQNGFINAQKGDSQDICFVPDGDYAAFIKQHIEKELPIGDYVDKNGNILGRHSGIINYTIGQRKGLGIALGTPMFVLSKDSKTNRVTIGDEEGLFYRRVEVNKLNFSALDGLEGDLRASAKLRYRHTEQLATLHPIGEDRLIIEFDTPQRAPSPGQAAVFYDGDTVIGGGTIVKGTD